MSDADTNASYEGDEEGLNLAWESDIKDRNVKNPNGVEYATAPSEQQGDVSFDFLPSDVDVEDLTESQREILATAAMRDPESVTALAEMVGYSTKWTRQTLSDFAPDLLEEVRMDRDESIRNARSKNENNQPVADTSDEDNTPTNAVDEEFVPREDHDQQRRVDEAILQCETLEKVHQSESEVGRAAREIRRTLEGER